MNRRDKEIKEIDDLLAERLAHVGDDTRDLMHDLHEMCASLKRIETMVRANGEVIREIGDFIREQQPPFDPFDAEP